MCLPVAWASPNKPCSYMIIAIMHNPGLVGMYEETRLKAAEEQTG
jgi:hypothetical protein